MFTLLRKEEIEKFGMLTNKIIISSEADVEWFFTKFYKFFGFDRISLIPDVHRELTCGDYFAWQGNRKKRVELELIGNSFFLHKPEIRKQIDVVVAGYFPLKKRSGLWEELKDRQTIDLTQWFPLHIVSGVQGELEIREDLNDYEREAQDPLCHLKDLKNWLDSKEQKANDFLLQTVEILQGMKECEM